MPVRRVAQMKVQILLEHRLAVRAMFKNHVAMELRTRSHDHGHRLTFGRVPLGHFVSRRFWTNRIDQRVRLGVTGVRAWLDDTNVVCCSSENGDNGDFPVREIIVREDRETVVAPGDICAAKCAPSAAIRALSTAFLSTGLD